jgi:hypothetical protein
MSELELMGPVVLLSICKSYQFEIENRGKPAAVAAALIRVGLSVDVLLNSMHAIAQIIFKVYYYLV